MSTSKLTTENEVLDMFFKIYENIEELEYQLDKSNQFQCMMHDNEVIDPAKHEAAYCFTNTLLISDLLIERRSNELILIDKIMKQCSDLLLKLREEEKPNA